MENIIFKCEFCDRNFSSKNACNSHRGKCKQNPNAKQSRPSEKWYEAMRHLDRKRLSEQTKKEYECPFCHKKWVVTKSGFGIHIKYCNQNPDKEVCIGHKVSEETKKKISESTKRAHDEGRGHTWKNRYLCPSYAEKWLYRLLDNNNILYEKEKPFLGFFLDVAIGNKCIEIDGEQHGEDPRFQEQVERDKRKDALLKEHGYKELRVKWSDIRKMPDYFANKILEFISTGEIIFDGEYALRKQKEEEAKEKRKNSILNGQVSKDGRVISNMLTKDEWQRRKDLIDQANVDLNKFGCLTEIERITGLSRRQIKNTMEYFNIKYKSHS